MDRIKDLFSSLLILIMAIYFLSASIAMPYFSWQYAKAHGFWNWAVLGLIIPTLKATVWPYFVFIDSERKAPIVVVPGKSIAGVELGMSRDRVISVLGKPTKEISSQDIGQMGQFRVLGKGPFTGEMPRMTILEYSTPPLVVVLHDDNQVGALQLGYTDSVSVEEFDFLKFKYLSKEEIALLGKPSAVVRDENAEHTLLPTTPEGTKIEYYVYTYDHLGMKLGLIFDKSREHSSKYFIGVNYIWVGVIDVLVGEIVP